LNESFKDYRDKIITNRKQNPYQFDNRNTASYYLFCMSRYTMLKETIETNPFNSTHFSWINFCIERMGFKNLIRLDEGLAVNRDKFSTCYIDYIPQNLVENTNEYFKWGRCSMCSGFFTGNKEYMYKVCNLIENKFLQYLELGYGHADEQLYSPVYFENPELFEHYYGDYHQMITNYKYIYDAPEPPIYNFITRSFENKNYIKCYEACKFVFNSYCLKKCNINNDFLNRLYYYYMNCKKHIKQNINIMKSTKYKMIVNIFACATVEKYKQEILKINKTWGKKAEENGIKILFFLGEEKTDLIDENKYIYLKDVKNDYNSAAYKQNLGLKYIYENYNVDFVFTCGTDTYINIDNLLSYISQFDKNKKLYIGGDGGYRMIGNDNIYYHSGGSGFILTNSVLSELYSQLYNLQNEWTTICSINNVQYLIPACDVLIGYYISKIPNIEIIKNENFHGCNYKGYANNNTFKCCGDKVNISEIIACHHMSLTDFDEYTNILNKKVFKYNMDFVKNKFNQLCSNPSDINEHLPTLYKYATKCESVIELGVRGCVSSWAFTHGLLNNNKSVKEIFLNDLEKCDINELLNVGKNTDIKINYEWINDLKLEVHKNYDLTFIDTWHVYGQLKRELEKYSKVTNKYIIMHDTTVDEILGETIRNGWNAIEQSLVSGFPIEEINCGLWSAVEEFLQNNTDWVLKERYTNNNGLTILEKSNEIPIIIVCYNNYKYVQNTVNQIQKINKEYYNNIKILDNCSTCVDTIKFLKNTKCNVIYNTQNNGPWISEYVNKHIYDGLPKKFILTDPDLEFNKNLPSNFIDILLELSDKYSTSRIGFALDISDFDKMYETMYTEGNKTIYDWEIQFWNNKINDSDYELYNAIIDTTFCLINKNIQNDKNIRIAGNFTAKHLPWYKNNSLMNVYENYLINNQTTIISTNLRVFVPYIENNFFKINKNDEFFLIEKKDNNNLDFWVNTYTNWENETFEIFDRFLNKNKIFIDIGGWIGTTSMYGSRKSKHVYTVEADKKSFEDMSLNCKNNCEQNYTLINNAIYNVDNIEIKFGKNKFLNNSKMNDSTSQIYTEEESSSEFYLIKTITLQSVIENNNIKHNDISLIKVDIEGGEEFILNDLYNIHKTYNSPLYVSFHYDWWKDKNLNRFDFLTEYHKNNILNNPFISILFNS
jgi:FkbM family methyltransferase